MERRANGTREGTDAVSDRVHQLVVVIIVVVVIFFLLIQNLTLSFIVDKKEKLLHQRIDEIFSINEETTFSHCTNEIDQRFHAHS